jgi:hypothetical protein
MSKISPLLGVCLIALLVVLAMLGLPEVLKGQQINSIVDPKLEGEAVSAALRQLDPSEIKNLQKREVENLLHEPFSSSSLKNLILLSGLSSDKQVQEQLALQISKFSKRNVAAQVGNINILLARRRFGDALIEVDALLRARPKMTDVVLPALLALASDKDGIAALANTLKIDPPWRAEFFQSLIKNDPDGNAPLAILNALRNSKAPVKSEELTLLIGTLIVGKKIEKAYFVWLDFLPPEDLIYVETVFDGGFEREPKNLYFDWTIIPRNNAKIFVDFRPGTVSNRSLVIDFFDDKGFFSNVSQLTQIFPGKYQVSFEFKAQNLKAEKGLIWKFSCIDGLELGKSEALQKSGPWQTLTFLVEVPDENCNSQVLRLESVSAAELDTNISGKIYFDGIQIAPLQVTKKEIPN